MTQSGLTGLTLSVGTIAVGLQVRTAVGVSRTRPWVRTGNLRANLSRCRIRTPSSSLFFYVLCRLQLPQPELISVSLRHAHPLFALCTGRSNRKTVQSAELKRGYRPVRMKHKTVPEQPPKSRSSQKKRSAGVLLEPMEPTVSVGRDYAVEVTGRQYLYQA